MSTRRPKWNSRWKTEKITPPLADPTVAAFSTSLMRKGKTAYFFAGEEEKIKKKKEDTKITENAGNES